MLAPPPFLMLWPIRELCFPEQVLRRAGIFSGRWISRSPGLIGWWISTSGEGLGVPQEVWPGWGLAPGSVGVGMMDGLQSSVHKSDGQWLRTSDSPPDLLPGSPLHCFKITVLSPHFLAAGKNYDTSLHFPFMSLVPPSLLASLVA